MIGKSNIVIAFPFASPHVADNGEAVPSRRLLTRSTSYIPYGEVFVEESSAGWQSPYYFNSKELDEETGLYYYGARYLNPTEARWMSVDPMWEKYAGMSPYNYCAGNPVKFVDVDGNRIVVYSRDDNNEAIQYHFETGNDGKGAFYDKDGNVYNKNEDFILKLSDALNTLNEGETGKSLVRDLEGRIEDVTILRSRHNLASKTVVLWNPESRTLLECKDISGNDERPSYIGLAHEMAHVQDYLKGTLDGSKWYCNANGKTIPISEQYATFIENKIRDEHKIPLRPFYNEKDDPESSLIKFNDNGSISSRFYNHTFKQTKEYGKVRFY
ncbi:MAG: M91 family zinc metallopeptidase [Paludibacteraceae bacterium]|nr:M91 family zinc metallopeptidase [Paludibacteraceae bacterium]